MTALIALEGIELVPVVELEPGMFSAGDRRQPSGSFRDVSAEWDRYWLDSLADSGVVGLRPLRPGSWHVPTRRLTSPDVLGRILKEVVREWGGPDQASGPDGSPPLSGGFALCRGGDVLIEPACCGDLGDLIEWREAADYRMPGWRAVWIGHPWISVRFDADRLIFSEPHESDNPTGGWSVRPEELGRAVVAAEAELVAFARRLLPALEAIGVTASHAVALRMAGLDR